MNESTVPTAQEQDAELTALRALVEGTAQVIGDDFFRALVENLARATGVQSAFVAVFADDRHHARTLAYWEGGAIVDNITWELAGTP